MNQGKMLVKRKRSLNSLSGCTFQLYISSRTNIIEQVHEPASVRRHVTPSTPG